jgi:hypothetical protein
MILPGDMRPTLAHWIIIQFHTKEDHPDGSVMETALIRMAMTCGLHPSLVHWG